MSLTYSRQNIKFVKLACDYAACLAILPSYDFDKQVIIKPTLYKIYSVNILCLVIFSFSCHQYFIWMNLLNDGLYFTAIVMIFSQFVMLILCLLSITSSAFYGMDQWKKLLQFFQTLEKHLNQETKRERSFLKNFYIQFILTNILVAAVLINAFLCWSLYAPNKISPWYYMSHALDLFLIYIKSLKVTIVYNLILAIKCKYQDLNRLLIRGCSYWNWELPRVARIVSHSYGLLGETVGTYNKLFGWELILSLFHSTAIQLVCFNFARGSTVPGSNAPLMHLISNAICLFVISVVRNHSFRSQV